MRKLTKVTGELDVPSLPVLLTVGSQHVHQSMSASEKGYNIQPHSTTSLGYVGPQIPAKSQVNFRLVSLSSRSHFHMCFVADKCWNARARMASVFRLPAIRDHCRATCLAHISEETVPQRHRQSIAPHSHPRSVSLPIICNLSIQANSDCLSISARRNGLSTTWGGILPADTVRHSSLRGHIPAPTPRG